MTQEKAQSIIIDMYGSTAYAIGYSESTTESVIYWLYKGESEDNFKFHICRKGEGCRKGIGIKK